MPETPANPPAAYAVDQPDFDYRIGVWIDVLLNGEIMDNVVAYDCKAGWVKTQALDANGKIQLDESRKRVLLVKWSGRVEARWKRANDA